MSTAKHLRVAIAIAAFSIVSVSPAFAQGNGKAKGKAKNGQQSEQVQRQRPTLQLRPSSSTSPQRAEDRRVEDRRVEDRRVDDRRVDDRRVDDRRSGGLDDILWGNDGRARRNVPPGWCRGRGNPHNTPENCGYSGSDRRYDDYGSDRDYGGYGGSGSYAEAHAAFHRNLDREYAARAAQRRSDPIYQIRLRTEKAADHQRWHERTGTRH
jgi:hypothetical protein